MCASERPLCSHCEPERHQHAAEAFRAGAVCGRSCRVRALGPAAAFRGSLDLLKRRPLAITAVGLALYTSSMSVCCGFGVIAAPWFACELLGLLLSAGLDRPMVRNAAWLWAGLVQMVAIVVLSSVASLALMSLVPDVAMRSVTHSSLSWQLGQGLLVMAVAGGLVLSLTVYFEHAPAILIERGGGFIAALLESARLVSLHGTLRTAATSAVAHGLPMATGLTLIVVLTLRATLAAAVGFTLLLLPLLVFSLVLGQGMMVASYLHLCEQVTDPSLVPLEAAPSKSGTAVWAVLLSCVALGPVAVTLGLLKPALPLDQGLPAGASLLLSLPVGPTPRELYVPGTALTLRVAEGYVRLLGSDGGGAGTLPLPSGKVRSVRVAQLRSDGRQLEHRAPGEASFAIEVRLDSARVLTTWVDEAGVRLDDSLGRRLSLRLSPWGALLLVLCFAWTAVWISSSLPPQARIRRRLAGKRPIGLDAEHERRLRVALRARALGTALWLVPPALGSLTIGLSALVR